MDVADYVVTYPTNVAVDERVKKFISAFYAVSDDASRNEEWLDYFSPDALLVMGDKRARGAEEIRELRKGMWEKVKTRKHKLDKVFPAAFEAHEHESEWRFEYMLHGSVEFELKSGEKSVGQWAGRAILTNDGERLKYALYQVYLHILSISLLTIAPENPQYPNTLTPRLPLTALRRLAFCEINNNNVSSQESSSAGEQETAPALLFTSLYARFVHPRPVPDVGLLCSKKKDKNAKDSGGVVAAVTRHRAKISNGSVGKDVTPPPESPVFQSPEIEPATPTSIPANDNPSISPLLDAVSATSISASTAPSTNDWSRAMGTHAGSPSNLISIMGDSPPTQPSSYEDSRGLPYAWSAHQQQQQQQQQWRHHVNGKPYSASPPTGGRRPLSFQIDHYPTSDFRSQASSPPGVRRSSMHSPFPPPRIGANPPLPHQPQPHFYGAPDIDFDMHHKTGLKAGERGFYFGFDTLPRSSAVQASGNDHVVLAGYEGGMDIYSVNKRGVEPLATLKGLRGGVYNAKILPWNGPSDPFGIFPLVALVVHGPVPPLNLPDVTLDSAFDNTMSPKLEGIHTPQSESSQRPVAVGKSIPIIEAYQTSVEVYSLATNQLIDVLLQAPKTSIKASVTSPVFRSPQPTGAFQIHAEDGNIVVASGTTGECWVYRQVRHEQDPGYRFSCIGKLWTSLQQSVKSDSASEGDAAASSVPPRKRPQTPILAVSGRWLAYCPPPASSQIALNASMLVPIEGKTPRTVDTYLARAA
ncbi:hypothetical protein NUW58_g7907 [Xylaria curta]|uniref:Uncharacterized protein n=1 Tax=Xylaria curta TaxID=42375 RepID=A0ACC1NE09_9PEZI|nr:hypothetical protein NUW58_g7907 [Xylaria curta]